MKPVPASTSGKPAIIFDFGGVLLDWDPRYLYRKLFSGDEAAMNKFLEEIDFFGWNQQQDAGRPFEIAVAEACSRFPQYCDLIKAYPARYEESLSGPIWDSVVILQSLRNAKYSLYGLSNWPAEMFYRILPKYPFLGWFQDIVISGEVGLNKPDPRIFQILLDRVNRPAGDCLLIDDSQKNIQTAQDLGFQTILFQSPAQLREELMRKNCWDHH